MEPVDKAKSSKYAKESGNALLCRAMWRRTSFDKAAAIDNPSSQPRSLQ